MKKIYVCGPTIYSKVHIGNLKPMISFDIFTRSLEYLGKDFFYVSNITDIDDKIINRSKELGISELKLISKCKEFYLKMLKEYNIKLPNKMPSVIENIEGIISFIKKLIEKNDAYEKNGSVYFSVDNFPDYGQISNNKIADLSSNELEKGEKNSIFDFAVWKKTNIGLNFSSPWGKGRPGWHTECVYFIEKFFKGKNLDIHGGGIDLIFPHHENESIQFKSVYGKKISKDFIHTGLFNYGGEKMSKSIGNILYADDFQNNYGADTLRMLILTSSLKSPVNLTEDLIKACRKKSLSFSKIFFKIKLNFKNKNFDFDKNYEIAKDFSNWKFSFGMKKINEKIKQFNQLSCLEKNVNLCFQLVDIFEMLGFSFTKRKIKDEEFTLFEEWNILRKNKEFVKADYLRVKLEKLELI